MPVGLVELQGEFLNVFKFDRSHNFRPSYLRLRASILRAKLNVKCMLAMTATATSKTLQEIMHALEIPAANLIQTCQIRDNIQLFVISSGNRQDCFFFFTKLEFDHAMAFPCFNFLCRYSINYRLKDLLMLMKSSSLVDKQSVIIYCKFQVCNQYSTLS